MSRPSEVSAARVAPTATVADALGPVRTRGLTKRFAHQVAVDAVDLVVPAGAVYGFLGPNGSGKTTTIRMLLGLIRPTSGEVDLLGSPMAGEGAQRRLRAAPGRRPGRGAGLPPVPVRSGQPAPAGGGRPVRRRAHQRGAGSTPPWTGSGLLTAARKRYRAYSLGMRQRLAIASALLVPRDLLVLDEPTNGLDPQGTREVRHLVSELAADGTTVLVSSHLLSEVEQMCSHVGVMYAGRLVAQQTLADLYAGTAVSVRVRTTEPVPPRPGPP